MKLIREYWKIILVISVPLALVLLSYIYVRVGYKKPIFAINYTSNKIANGTRYDGILFSTIYCKDGTNKVKTRFTKYSCSSDRIFTDGYYINENNVKISKEIVDKYKLSNTFSDIDDITQNDYDALVKLFDRAENGTLKSYSVYGESEDGYSLYIESETNKISCRLGTLKDGDFILGDYIDGKCVIPDNITKYVTDSNAMLVPCLLTPA